MSEVLRPLTLGELLDRAITLYRRNVLVFAGIMALPSLLGLVAGIGTMIVLGGSPPDFSRVLILLAWTPVFALVSIVAHALSQAASTVAVSRLHLGQPVTIAASFAAVRGQLLRICMIMVVLGILSMLGLFLFIIPGVFLYLRWSLAVPAAVLENLGLGGAMERSATLVEGQYGRIFLIYVLYLLLAFVLVAAFQTPLTIIHLTQGGALAQQPLWMQLANQLLSFVTQVFVGPLLMIALALSYYDARVRKEAFDLQHMLAQLDAGDPQVAAIP